MTTKLDESGERSCVIEVETIEVITKQFYKLLLVILVVEFFKVKHHVGKCVALMGGTPACQSASHMLPFSPDCL